MSDDELKRRILSRRARFVAAAIAASTIAGCGTTKPQVCLEPVVPDASGDAAGDAPADAPEDGPQACLKVAPDAGDDAAPNDSGAG